MIADKYDVRGLKNIAQKRLIKGLSFETVCDTFEFAAMIDNAEALQAACSDFYSQQPGRCQIERRLAKP